MTSASMPRWWLRCLVTTLAGLVVTVVVVLYRGLSFTFTAPVPRAVLETAVTIVGGLVAFLVVGRYRRRRQLADLAIAVAVATLALNYPLFVALPSLIGGPVEDVGSWVYLIAHASSAALLCWASGQSFAAERQGGAASKDGLRPVSTPPRGHRFAVQRLLHRPSVPLYVVAATGLVVLVVLSYFGFDPDGSGWGAHRPVSGLFPAHPGPPIVRLISFVLFLVAAGRFAWRNQPGTDRLIGWLGVGCSILAVGDLEYGLYPPAAHGDFHLGDVFRLAAVLVFAVGVAAEIRSYWYEGQELARLEARRAVAADLHDGIAQELAFLSALVRGGARTPDHPAKGESWMEQVRAATDRALVESRRAIAALIADEPFALSGDLAKVVREIAPEGELDIDVEIEERWLDRIDRDALVLIVREAVRNAVRHGRSSVVRVVVTGDRWPILRVIDNGTGFDPATAGSSGGFGILTMRERARAVGGGLSIDAAPGRGTVVEVSWGPNSGGGADTPSGTEPLLGFPWARRRAGQPVPIP